jgi:hypothetical protein
MSEPKERSLQQTIVAALGATCLVISYVGFFVFHFWTAYFLYKSMGLLAGIIGLFVPVLAEFVALGINWHNLGIINYYSGIFLFLMITYQFGESWFKLTKNNPDKPTEE